MNVCGVQLYMCVQSIFMVDLSTSKCTELMQITTMLLDRFLLSTNKYYIYIYIYMHLLR